MKNPPYIQDWFSQQVTKFSQQIAISYGVRQFTYNDLERKANQLANFLISQGVIKGSLVGICSEDCLQNIVAIIGILKAGCVFVPLSPKLPISRLEMVISDINLQWIAVDNNGLEIFSRLRENILANLNLITQEEKVVQPKDLAFLSLKSYSLNQDFNTPTIRSEPDDMCYLYFTSGSTGKPKAIAGRLKSIKNFIDWEIETLNLKNSTRFSQLINPSFDAFLRDIFVPLCSGGVVCVPESVDTILDGRKLVQWLNREKINVIHCVPSLFRSILNEDLNPQLFSNLQYILLSGEPIYGGDVARWSQTFGDRVQLINLYGASETTMTKFCYFIKSSDQQRQIIPIGQPIKGAAALVVDERGRICPTGMIGEIYVRTPYRSLGYYQQDALTNEVFVVNPFSNNPNDLIYKTGDMGRVSSDGNFEYLGRKDRQVKIRGIRIELGEIENYLRLSSAIKESAVIDINDTEGNKYLCAYLVLKHSVEVREIREYLRDFLPEMMIPSSFVIMESLPKTISGKIDRKSLPSPTQNNRKYVAPRTPIEIRLAEIWTQVLNIQQIGIDDDFFELGGHSLLATQLVSCISRAWQVEIPLKLLFDSPILATQAESIETLLWMKNHSSALLEELSEEGEL